MLHYAAYYTLFRINNDPVVRTVSFIIMLLDGSWKSSVCNVSIKEIITNSVISFISIGSPVDAVIRSKISHRYVVECSVQAVPNNITSHL